METKAAGSLTHGRLGKQILAFSLPLMLSNVLQVLFNMSDIAVVGRFSGPIALGAVADPQRRSLPCLPAFSLALAAVSMPLLRAFSAQAAARRHSAPSIRPLP